jgi:uncharacterized protein YodC (DUF2158 family)
MSEIFQVGDTVTLKSGSDRMTVRSIEGDEVFCEWFSNGSVRGHLFLLAQLEKVG